AYSLARAPLSSRASGATTRIIEPQPSLGGEGSAAMTSDYRRTYDQWRADPQAFWANAAREISWTRQPKRIFDPDAGVYGRWFPDARCNPCHNALDRHVEAGRGDQAALYY